jgi:cyclase
MLKFRIIPILLLKNGRMVKTISFGDYRDVGDPIKTAKIYDAQRADELIFLDIDACKENRNTMMEIVREVSKECFMPFGVGGGIRSIEDIRTLLHGGADKVVINSYAVENPDFIKEASGVFGSSTIAISIDVRNKNRKNEVFTSSASKSTGLDPVEWAKKVEEYGAGEIIINDADRDGKMQGLNMKLIRDVADAVSVPVIAVGGVATLKDFQDAFENGHAQAVGAGSIFHFTDQSIIKTRRYLVNEGVNVRR